METSSLGHGHHSAPDFQSQPGSSNGSSPELELAVQLAGLIQSPSFPYGYGSNVSATWKRCAPPGHVLVLTLLHLDLEESFQCENDFLEVSEHGLLAKLCGRKTSEELRSVDPSLRSSSGGCLSITFQSDYSNTERHTGFQLFYTTQDVDECWENIVMCSHFCHNYIGGYSCTCKPGYYLDEDQHECHADCTEQRHGAGVLTPPGSPGPYFENANCSYRLSVNEGEQLWFKFTGVFDVESRHGQCVDFVKIKTDSETFGPFCGKDKPADILSSSQRAEVTFYSDLEGTNQGFTLEYKPKGMECTGKVTPDAIVSPERDFYKVGESVLVQCVTGYVLSDSDDDNYESTCQLNGEWKPKDSCEPVDCGFPELPELMELTEENPETTYKHRISVCCPQEFYQLEGKANFTCHDTGEWVAENGEIFSEESPQCVPVCGITKPSAAGRVFGGQNAKLGEVPWQLLAQHPRGGASLINDRWAITAAHVVENKKTMTFMGRMVNVSDKNAFHMETEMIIIHPDYKKDTYNNDIALVKMSSRVPLSRNLLPVCLPKTKTDGPALENTLGTISGFGATGETMRSEILQYGHVTEFPGVCVKTKLAVTNNMFCAGGKDNSVDSCKGDSGGPLVIPMLGFGSAKTPYRLKGIVSWGPELCGIEYNKGYYTKVENYLQWISDTMKNN
ncbi:mannan-binding lectin serine protease 2-like [Tachysurus ichikawai]